MQIRSKLTLWFMAIAALILLFASVAIYFFSSNYRQAEFFSRLHDKASATAHLLIEVEEIDINLMHIIERATPGKLPHEQITIYNYENEILYTSDAENRLNVDSALLDKVRLEEEVWLENKPFEVLGILYADKYDRFVVIAAAQDIYGFNKLSNLRTILFFVFIISLFLMLILGWFFSGQALEPVSHLIDQVDSISVSHLSSRVDEGNGKDEMGKLAKTFNKLLTRVEEAFLVQKNFVSNASHEIRTPLTAISGQLEVLLMKDRSKEKYMEAVISVLQDIRHLIDISNKLLMLAQASSEEPNRSFTGIRIDDILWKAQDEVQRRNPDYIILIDFKKHPEDEHALTIWGSEPLLKAALTNLMDNGCKFSENNTVEVNIDFKGKELLLTFIDEGIGINDADKPHIFQPFYRSENAIQIFGHGIGLSLVQKIIHLHGGNISFQSTVGKGTTFTIILPSTA